MKKIVLCLVVAFLSLCFVIPAFADLVGDCYDCHTMHNSEQGAAVFAGGPQPSLLRTDCLGCHAQSPSSGTRNWIGPGGSSIPQVAHGDTTDLAGGNFNQTTARKVHSVVDITSAGIAPTVSLGENVNDQPPGLPHSSNRHVFTSEAAVNAFDMFTCAGARGCHGTRSQALVAGTVDNGTSNNWEITSRRTGIAAITGAHHNNIDGKKVTTGYDDTAAPHDGQIVADGYRFIVGLQGFENTAREYVSNTDHNEYYGKAEGIGGGCGACHVQDSAQSNTRAGMNSGIVSINNSMSGFCSSCHGYFHSSGGGDYTSNSSTSGVFLRHPSDYVLPSEGDYSLYTVYDPTAPVMRPSVFSQAGQSVRPGTDMVGCLSCHVAHGSANDYLLRFDYTTMTAGSYGSLNDSAAAGGCMACHRSKGVLPQNR